MPRLRKEGFPHTTRNSVFQGVREGGLPWLEASFFERAGRRASRRSPPRRPTRRADPRTPAPRRRRGTAPHRTSANQGDLERYSRPFTIQAKGCPCPRPRLAPVHGGDEQPDAVSPAVPRPSALVHGDGPLMGDPVPVDEADLEAPPRPACRPCGNRRRSLAVVDLPRDPREVRGLRGADEHEHQPEEDARRRGLGAQI